MNHNRNWKVDDLIDNMLTFKQEAMALREICLQTELLEDRKWGQPCYTYQGKNVVAIGAFKHYISLSFFKGILIEDDLGVLISPGDHSRHFKQLRFKHLSDINSHKEMILSYLQKAIAIEASGLKIKPEKQKAQPYPPQLLNYFKENKAFETAFESLTPGRKRSYLIHFNQAKQPQTVIRRIEKNIDRILDKKGLNE